MKLIDILVEELPKRGGWPDGVRYITQDNGCDTYKGTICGYDSLPEFNRKIWLSNKPDGHADVVIMRINNIASDYTTAIITCEQYESALAAKNESWIEWRGGRRPVDDVTEVDIKFRTGGIAYGVEAGKYYWPRNGQEYDIIAYRLHKSQEAEQVNANGKADLNERIEQDVAPVCNGEGLPPVGMKVEWLSDKYGWLGGTVAAHDAKYPLIAIIRHNDGYTGCHRHEIRTEAERKREAARNGIYAAMDIVDGDIADAIYDAIAAGKIPGVKLED